MAVYAHPQERQERKHTPTQGLYIPLHLFFGKEIDSWIKFSLISTSKILSQMSRDGFFRLLGTKFTLPNNWQLN